MQKATGDKVTKPASLSIRSGCWNIPSFNIYWGRLLKCWPPFLGDISFSTHPFVHVSLLGRRSVGKNPKMHYLSYFCLYLLQKENDSSIYDIIYIWVKLSEWGGNHQEIWHKQYAETIYTALLLNCRRFTHHMLSPVSVHLYCKSWLAWHQKKFRERATTHTHNAQHMEKATLKLAS